MEKAPSICPDAVFLDLEDSIPAGPEKDYARRALPLAVSALREIPVYVRVNDLGSGYLPADVAAAIRARPTGLVLPKIESGDEIRRVEHIMAEVDSSLTMSFIVIIETAAALLRLDDIAGSSPRIVALALGSEDLFADLRISPPSLTAALAGPRSALVTAARAHGLAPIDTVFTDFSDQDGLVASLQSARGLGMDGMLALHPSQVPIANAIFTPTHDEILWARSVQMASQDLARTGSGVGILNGEFIGPPIRRRADQILLRARQCGVMDA